MKRTAMRVEPREIRETVHLAPWVVSFPAVGDLVLMTGFLTALRDLWGRPPELICGRLPAERVLRGLDCVAGVHSMRSRRKPYWLSPPQRAIARCLRARPPTPVWSTEIAAYDQIERFLVQRAGRRREHCTTFREVPRGDLEHVTQWMARFLRCIPPGFEPPDGFEPPEVLPPPTLCVLPEERADCRAWLEGRGWTGEPIVLIQSQSRRTKRGRWPVESWRTATGEVRRELPEARIIFVGSPDEGPTVEGLVAEIGIAGVWTACEDLPLRRLFALCEVADSCISVDTGPAHAAAALGCSVAVVVGRADPRRCRPIGRPGRVEIVAAWPREKWPATRKEWEASHRLAEVPPGRVVAAWRRVREARHVEEEPSRPPPG